MNRHFLSLIFTLLFSTGLYGQETANIIDSLQRLIKKSPDSTKGSIYLKLGRAYIRQSHDSSERYTNEALKFADKMKDEQLKASCYSQLGVIEKNRANYETSIKYHLQALGIMEKLKNEKGAAISYNDIGVLYKQMIRWDDALKYYRKSNELTKKIGLTIGIAMTYTNIGTIFQQKEIWDSAIYYYDSGYYYAEKSGSPSAIVTSLANIGEVYIAKEKYDAALNSFLKCLEIDKTYDDTIGMISSYFQVGRAYVELDQYKKGMGYIDTAEQIATSIDLKRELVDIAGIKSEIEERRGNYKSALAFRKQYMALKDSIVNNETALQVSELQTKYETEKKERQIILQRSEISKRNYIIAGICIFLVLASALAFSYYNRYKLRQQDKLQKAIIRQQELATQAVIEAEEKERKRIAGDLHDGVGQTMSAAKMNLSVIANDIPFKDAEQKAAFDKAMYLVDEGCKEVRTVSHNIMPNALLKTGLASAIREFLDKIDSKVIKVTMYTEGLDERMTDKVETVLYRVIQECVNNVIKHSGANTMDMTLIRDEDGLSVTIEDNGKGFDLPEAKQKDGIGLQNLQTRINYLKGTIEWDTTPGKGTVVTIQVPEPGIG